MLVIVKNLLIQKLKDLDKFKEFADQIEMKKTPICLSGLEFVGKSHIIATTIDSVKKPICIVTYNELQAQKLVKDLKFFTDKIEYFGKREIASYDYITESKDLPYARIEVLNKIYNKDVKIVVTTIEAIMQKMIPKKVLYKNILSFSVGNLFECAGFSGKKNLNNLKQLLLLMGYERSDLVENRGQFSIRGGIVDIGLSEKMGVRIEFWGDDVDSIRYFSISSQRTTEMTDKISIFPAHEYVLDYEMQDNVLPEYSEIVARITNSMQEKYLKNIHTLAQNIQADIEAIQNGEYISKIDKYFNEFYTQSNTFLDYLPKNCLLFIDENLKINQRIENIIIENNNLIKSLAEKERFVPEAIQNISDFSKDDWNEIYTSKQVVYLDENNSSSLNKLEFNYRQINFFKSETEILISDIKKWQSEGKEVIVLAGNKENVDKVEELLEQNGILAVPIVTGGLSSGFECYDLNLVVISMAEALEGEVKKRKTSSTFRQGEKIVFADLKQGDFVVHRTHGIGQFVGVNTIEADGVIKDYIKIKYKNDDMLYVPTNNLDNVRKYIGGGDTAPKLNRLGSKEWSNTKNRVKNNLREVAKDLIELYAKRQKIKGFAFSEDTDWQRQFEDEFPYQETDDQLRCIEEVKKDMETPRPMDRLLCGDVGYGKTEVAIRAAFKAVMDHKQVAYLVPTTVLANQQ